MAFARATQKFLALSCVLVSVANATQSRAIDARAQSGAAAAPAATSGSGAAAVPPARRLEDDTNASGICCIMANCTDACACREADYALWSTDEARSAEACLNATGFDWCASLDHTSDDAILAARCEAYGTDCKSGVCCIMDGPGSYDSPCDCEEADYSLWQTDEARSADACRSTPGRDWCATLDHTSDDSIRDERCETYGTDCESGVQDFMYWVSDQARSRRECEKIPGLEWCNSLDHTSDDDINEALRRRGRRGLRHAVTPSTRHRTHLSRSTQARCIVYGINCGASLFPGLGSFNTDEDADDADDAAAAAADDADDADDDPSGICCHLNGFQGTRSYADACECRIADYYVTTSDDGPGSSEATCNSTANSQWCPSIDHPGDLDIDEARCFIYGLCGIGRDPIPDPPTPAPTITPQPTDAPTTSPPSPKPTSRPTRAPTTPKPTAGGSTDGALPRHAVEFAVAVAAFVAYLVL